MIKRFVALTLAIVVMQAFPATAGSFFPLVPKPGGGKTLIIIELQTPDRATEDQIHDSILADPKLAAKYKDNPTKLDEEIQTLLNINNEPGYTVLMGKNGDGGFAEGTQTWLVYDRVAHRKWLLAMVPSGPGVVYGLLTQHAWTIRFDQNSINFDGPSGGYLYIGGYDGEENRQQIIRAVNAGRMPSTAQGYAYYALCGEAESNFTPPNPDAQIAAQAFVRRFVEKDVSVPAAQITNGPFFVRQGKGPVVATCF